MLNQRPSYDIFPVRNAPEFSGCWDGPAWGWVPPLDVAAFRHEGSSHRPPTQCKLLYVDEGIYGFFRVADRFVRCVHTGYQDEVWRDSCVEIFLEPREGGGYVNLEFNAGGALLTSYVTDPTRENGRVRGATPLPPSADAAIRRRSSLPPVVEPERPDAILWTLEFFFPFACLAASVGPLGPIPGQIWRGNAYKCGNDTSHPHWAAWAPLTARNFHDPESFGILTFVS